MHASTTESHSSFADYPAKPHKDQVAPMKPAQQAEAMVDLESQSQGSAEQKRPKAQAVNTEEWVRGDPGPFGLLCFGMTTCMLMFIVTKWTDKTFLPMVYCYALFYGGAGQFFAGMLELIKGNTFGGTAFASYGCFWMGWFLLHYLQHFNATMFKLAKDGMSLWCGLWAVLTFGFFIVTMRKNGCLMTIFSTLTVTFALLAGGIWSENTEQAAGYFGFFCGSSAIYAAFAFLYKIELGIYLPGVRPVAFI